MKRDSCAAKLTAKEADQYTFASGQVAQSVERSPEKAGVGGSIPSLATILSASYRHTKT